jgi:hypothetical protein
MAVDHHAGCAGRRATARKALRDYVIRRLLLMIPTFLGITFATFTALPVRAGRADRPAPHGAGGRRGRASWRGGGRPGPARHPRRAARPAPGVLRLRQPLPVAYASWLGRVPARPGQSFRYNEPVTGHRRPAAGLDLLRADHRLLHLWDLHPARDPEGDPAPDVRRQRSLDPDLHRLRDSGVRAGAVLSNLFAVRFEIFPLGGFQSAGAASFPLHEQIWTSSGTRSCR